MGEWSDATMHEGSISMYVVRRVTVSEHWISMLGSGYT